jgi:hypothetical protein
MSTQSSSSPHQFDAYWRNHETGELEGVSNEVYAQKKAESKQRDTQRYEDSARTSDHLFNSDAPTKWW